MGTKTPPWTGGPAPGRDLAAWRGLVTHQDLAAQPDLAPDLAAWPDLAALRDLSSQPDPAARRNLPVPPDLAALRDLSAWPDLVALRELAAEQGGVITRGQALGCGLTDSAIKARLRSGRWRQVGFGVYATFTGDPHSRSLCWAAVLRAGSGAVLSFSSAAALDRLTDALGVPIHVTVPRRRRVDPIPGVVVHYSARIDAARHPCLQPPRTRIEETVLDLTQVARTSDEAFGWLCRAVSGRFTTAPRLRAAMDARSRLRRRAGLLAALDDVGAGAHSVLELRYLRIERAHRLPLARRQARLRRGGRHQYLDSCYEEYGVAVELDGRIAHPPAARWRDMRRDNAGAAEGILTLRYGYADVTERPCQVAAEVGRVLQSRGWRGKPRPCGPECTMGKDPGR